MNGGLSPVGGAPRHVNTGAEGVVGQQLIQVVTVHRLQDSLGTRCGIGGARGGLIYLQVSTFLQQRVGVALIAVELEVGLSCRLTDHEHHHCLLIVCNLAVGQLDLLLLFVVTEANHATSIHHIRPGLQQSAQFGIMLRDKQCLVEIR